MVTIVAVEYMRRAIGLQGDAVAFHIDLGAAYCALEPACLEFHRAKRPVRTASAVQVRQPVFRTSVGRWKHYEHPLAPLFARLERVTKPRTE